HTEIDASALGAWHWRDLYLAGADAGFEQQSAQPHVDPRRRADAASLHHAEVAALAAKVLVHHQEPVHALSLGAQELGAAPLRKRRQRGMRGAANEIDRAVAHRRVAFVDRVDQLERNVEAFLLEATELDRRDRGKIRVRDHVGYGELHLRHFPTSSSALARGPSSVNLARSSGLVRLPVLVRSSRIQASLSTGIGISGVTAA